MPIRISIKDNNRLPEIIADLNKANTKKAHVGYREGELAKIAAVQEFGARIPVTDKMRGYLAAKGLYLRKDTTHIIIPERSFLRAGADAHIKDVVKKAEELLPLVVAGNLDPTDLFEALGDELKSLIQDFARDLDSPANHPFTIEQKGSDNPLVDSGGMIGRMESFVE